MPKYDRRLPDYQKEHEDLTKENERLRAEREKLVYEIGLPDFVKKLEEDKKVFEKDILEYEFVLKELKDKRFEEIERSCDKRMEALLKEENIKRESIVSLQSEIRAYNEAVSESKKLLEELSLKCLEIEKRNEKAEIEARNKLEELNRKEKSVQELILESGNKLKKIKLKSELLDVRETEIKKNVLEWETLKMEELKKIDFMILDIEKRKKDFKEKAELESSRLVKRAEQLNSELGDLSAKTKNLEEREKKIEVQEKELSEREQKYNDLDESMVFREKMLEKNKTDLEYEKRKFYARK